MPLVVTCLPSPKAATGEEQADLISTAPLLIELTQLFIILKYYFLGMGKGKEQKKCWHTSCITSNQQHPLGHVYLNTRKKSITLLHFLRIPK